MVSFGSYGGGVGEEVRVKRLAKAGEAEFVRDFRTVGDHRAGFGRSDDFNIGGGMKGPSNLGIGVECLVGDGVPPGVGVFIYETFGFQFAPKVCDGVVVRLFCRAYESRVAYVCLLSKVLGRSMSIFQERAAADGTNLHGIAR